MRFSFLPLLALLFTSCANQGTVVRKESNPLPFYHSLGVDGSYKLALRDNAGAVHSQLVTPEVYQDYAEGDYFNDTQPPLTPSANSANVKDTVTLRPAPTQTLAGNRLGNGKRLAGNAGGSGHKASMTATRRTPINHSIASVKKPAVSGPTAPKPAGPVVTASFSVAVQTPAPVQANALTAEVAPVNRPAIANGQNTSKAVSLTAVAPKSIALTNAPKAATNRVVTAPVSRRSYHIASSAPKTLAAAKVASSTAKVAPSDHMAFVTQKLTEQPETSAPSVKKATTSMSAKTSARPHTTSKSSKSKQHAKKKSEQ